MWRSVAEIVVIRESRFAGPRRTDPIPLDSVEIYRLPVGENVVMGVNPGNHIVRDSESQHYVLIGGSNHLAAGRDETETPESVPCGLERSASRARNS